MIKPGLGSVDSMFLVPGQEAEFEELKEVPHGEVRVGLVPLRRRSAAQREPARLHAAGLRGDRGAVPGLLPAARRRRRRLGLEHGRPGRLHPGQPARRQEGRADDRGDAQRQPAPPGEPARPSRPARRPRPRYGPRCRPPRTASPTSCSRTSSRSSRSTTASRPARENRAIAGLSMGGGQTLRVLLTHPDEFAYVAVWSAGVFGGNAEEFEKQNAAFLDRRRQGQQDGQAALDQSSATRTSPRRRLEGPGRGAARSTASSTSCTSAAAATPGSTGGTTSTSCAEAVPLSRSVTNVGGADRISRRAAGRIACRRCGPARLARRRTAPWPSGSVRGRCSFMSR